MRKAADGVTFLAVLLFWHAIIEAASCLSQDYGEPQGSLTPSPYKIS